MRNETRSAGLPTAFALVTLAYVLALAAAAATVFLLPGHTRILTTLFADLAATLVVYVFGRVFHNSSFYDPYWSVAPVAIAIYWAATSSSDFGLEQLIVMTLVCLWGIRLTWHWAAGWRGLNHEDWRYADLRQKTGRWFWLVELVGIDLMPTAVVFLGCLALYPVLTSNHTFGALGVLACILTISALIIESVADSQLSQFVKENHGSGALMESGLWGYSRHPNYLGEISFWWGLYLFALAAGVQNWWMAMGPLTITALFIFISVPMMDRRNLERRPGYSLRVQKVPALIPRLNRP